MGFKSFFKGLILVGLTTVLFLPLLESKTLIFPFITGKNFAFRIIVEIIFGLWVILAVWDKDYRPKRSLIFYSVLVFIAVATLATVFGVCPYQSFWSNFERMDGLINLLHLGLFFIVLISVLKTDKAWVYYLSASLVANSLVLFYGFGQLMGLAEIHQGGVRLDSSLGNAAYLATYCLFHIFIATYLFFKYSSAKWLFVCSVIANAIVLYFTATRGAILGLFGGLLLVGLILVWRRWNEPKVKKTALALVVFIVLALGLFWVFKDSAFVQDSSVLSRFASISLTETTTQARILVWEMAWRGFLERPILGWGLGNFSYVFSKHYDPLMWRQEPWFDRAHNIIFDWLINAGILGLLSYLFVLGSATFYLWKIIWPKAREIDQETKVKSRKKNKNNEASQPDYFIYSTILFGLLVAYFFQNLFAFDNLTSYLLFFVVLAYVHSTHISLTVSEKENPIVARKSAKSAEPDIPLNVWLVLPMVGVVLVFSLYQLNLKPIRAARGLIMAMANLKTDSEANLVNLAYFQKVFAAETFANREAGEQLLDKAFTIVRDETLPENLRLQYLNLAVAEWDKILAIYKDDVRSSYYYGFFLSGIGRYDEALVHLLRAKELSPLKQFIRFDLATLYLKMNQPDLAMKELKEAFELEPNYPEARKMYALGSFIVGDSELSAEIIKPIKDSPDYFLDDRFLYYYNQAKANQEIYFILENRSRYYADQIAQSPQKLENYFKLAQVQISLGQNDEAKSNLQTVMKSSSKESAALRIEAQNLWQRSFSEEP